MNIIDGTYSTAQATGLPRWVAFTPDNQHVAFEQDFWVAAASYGTKAPIWGAGTASASPLPTGFWLANERSLPVGDGSLLQLTRTYAKKPSDYDVWESYAMGFPKLVFASNVERAALNATVPSRIAHKFYLILSSGGDYTSVAAIPLEEKWTATFTFGSVTVNAPQCDYSGTDPSAEDYADTIAGTEQVAADSEISQWYGPIYVRKTRYVTMQ